MALLAGEAVVAFMGWAFQDRRPGLMDTSLVRALIGFDIGAVVSLKKGQGTLLSVCVIFGPEPRTEMMRRLPNCPDVETRAHQAARTRAKSGNSKIPISIISSIAPRFSVINSALLERASSRCSLVTAPKVSAKTYDHLVLALLLPSKHKASPWLTLPSQHRRHHVFANQHTTTHTRSARASSRVLCALSDFLQKERTCETRGTPRAPIYCIGP